MGVGKKALLSAHVKQYSLSLAKVCSMLARFVVFFLQHMKMLSHERLLYLLSFIIRAVLYLIVFTLSKRDVFCIQVDRRKESPENLSPENSDTMLSK
jgi:hypothetical protein